MISQALSSLRSYKLMGWTTYLQGPPSVIWPWILCWPPFDLFLSLSVRACGGRSTIKRHLWVCPGSQPGANSRVNSFHLCRRHHGWGGGVREHHRWALWPGFLRVYAWSQAGRVRGSLCPESAALLVGGGKKLNNSSSGFILSHTLC